MSMYYSYRTARPWGVNLEHCHSDRSPAPSYDSTAVEEGNAYTIGEGIIYLVSLLEKGVGPVV